MQNQGNGFIRSIVRGVYDLQKLRVMMGNRITGNFKAKLGMTQDGMSEKQLAKQEKKVLDLLRESYRRITDGIIEHSNGDNEDDVVGGKLPSAKKFKGDEIISSYTELVLVDQYMTLLGDENRHFKRLEGVLKMLPIYTTFLSKIRGIGPAMAGVIVSEIDISRAEYPSSLWKYCFPAGTMVSTMSGMVSIDHIQQGDVVLDAGGIETTVLDTMQKQYSGDLITINCLGTLPITMTDEHPVLVVRNSEPVWLEAKHIIDTDLLVMPTLRTYANNRVSWDANMRAVSKSPRLGMDVELTQDFLYLCGRFVGDGSASIWQEAAYQRGVCQISFGKHEGEDMGYCQAISMQEIGGGFISEQERSNNLVFGRATVAAKFQEWFGSGAENKKIPNFIMGLSDPDCIKSFLRGYIDADGHIVPNGKSTGTITASSVSKGLILQIQHLLTKIGIFGSVCMTERNNSVGSIDGREFQQNPFRFVVTIPTSSACEIYPIVGVLNFVRSKRKITRNDFGDWLIPITSIRKEFVSNINVFNLHTAGSNTYLVQNLAVHNCGIDVVTIGTYEDANGATKTLPAHEIDAFYAINDENVTMMAEGKYPVTLSNVGRSRKDFCLVNREYTSKDGELKTRKSITYNPFLKTKLLGVLGTSFLRSGTATVDGKKTGAVKRLEMAVKEGFVKQDNDIDEGDQVISYLGRMGHEVVVEPSEYGQCYYNYKNRLANSPHHAEKTDSHRHNMAIRFAVKRFLADLYVQWRTIEGLVVAPEYSEAKLGKVHGKA